MKRVLLALGCAAAMGVSAQVVAQQPEWVGYDNRWYVGVSGGVARLNSRRLTDSFSPYYGAYVGRFFSPNLSLELQIDSYSTEFEGTDLARVALNPAFDDSDFDIFAIGGVARWHFGAESDTHRPFAMLGIGLQEYDSFLAEGRDLFASAGVGLQSKLGDHWRVRSQLEFRYDNDRETRTDINADRGFYDMIASIGLSYSFGALPAPPPPPPPPAVTPAVRPAPPPPPPPPPPPEPEAMFEFDTTVLFDFDSAALRLEAEAELNEAAEVLRQRNELILIEVAGHTDSIGDEAYNQRLSERRAQAVADYLVKRGIARDRLRVVGFGESRPRVPNTTPENRQMNRRVVLSVLDRR